MYDPKKDWFNGGNEYPSFQFDNSGGFGAMEKMDQFLVVMDRVIVPFGELFTKFLDSTARHRQISGGQQQNRALLSMAQQQQEQVQQLMQQFQSMQYQQMPPPQFSMYPPQPPMYSQPMYSPPYLPPAPHNQRPVMPEIQWSDDGATSVG